MYSRLQAWSRGLYLAGIVLALVLVIPTAWFPFQLAKVAVFAALLLGAAVLFVAGGGMREFVRSHGAWATLAVFLLPAAYTLSAFLSLDSTVSWSGFSVEWDTVLFTTLAALAFVFSSALFRTQRTARLLYTTVLWALVAAVVFQFIAILFGTSVIPFQTFADRSVNLVGKWNDLGLLASLAFLFVLVQIELRRSSNLMRIGSMVLGVALVLLLAFVNFSLAWALVLVASLCVGLYSFISHRGEEGEVQHVPRGLMGRMPWIAIGSAMVSIAFIFWGPLFNTGLTSIFPVSSLEVRPSYQSTQAVLSAGRDGSFGRTLTGTGPNTFGELWLAHKPAEVNQSAFWNLDFNVGFSTLTTALGTVGVLGVLAWILPFLLVLAALARAWRVSVLNREDKGLAMALAAGSFLLLASMIFYVPSQNLILLALTLAGASFGFLWRQGRPAVTEEAPSRPVQLYALALGMLIIIAALVASAKTSQRALAEVYVGKASVALANGNADEALALAVKAEGIESIGDALRLQVDAGGTKLAGLAQNTNTPAADLQTQFAAALQSTIAAGQKAIAANPDDYRPLLSMARVYDLLSSLKVEGAYAQASSTYLAALSRNPQNPTITLALSRLSAMNGDQAGTIEYLRASLTQKPNYTDAILFLVQLNVANNDLNSAVQAAQAAVQSAPGVAPLWFQLGLLYYAGGAPKEAIAPLEQALKIQADYANAKYFLGLSYYTQSRQVEALQLFQDLVRTNPDNQEIKLVISNMQAGKPALEGATTTPTQSTTAPVQE
ncbi:MAG: hypothetical protein JWL87_75 [Candidatus Adlerbacteria bacterium]|nr:hypothetical protein [Candidatus Adlerbacteria bacterium]